MSEMVKPADDFWPRSLAHLAASSVLSTDEMIVVAEVTSEPVNGFAGTRLLTTALIPLEETADALATTGGIGHEVRSWGPRPCVDPTQPYQTSFWIDAREGSSKRYETIVQSWQRHDRYVLMPDNVFLMCYGLTPRFLEKGQMAWDDPSKPVYDVVLVTPESRYAGAVFTTARVAIRREYLEDYLHLKRCSAVTTFFEQRWSSADADIEGVLGRSEGETYDLPGRKLSLLRHRAGTHTHLAEVWGCRLLMTPQSRPITDGRPTVLTWPDHDEPVEGTALRPFIGMKWVHIRDEGLLEYEKRDEFVISPESGSISYGGWWGVGYCHRVGRDHIGIDLRKLYEGTPLYVIEHFNKFAVPQAVAERDRDANGNRHIGKRATDAINAFLRLTETLACLAEQLNVHLSQEDIGRFSTNSIEDHGWWTIKDLRPLGHVARVKMPHVEFLNRCTGLYKLLENVKPGSLKQILLGLGCAKDDLKDFKGLRLLGTLCQLATIANDEGLSLVDDFDEVRQQWDEKAMLDELNVLFALNRLRVVETHTGGSSTEGDVDDALLRFGIKKHMYVNGWGTALDIVYDQVTASLKRAAELIAPHLS